MGDSQAFAAALAVMTRRQLLVRSAAGAAALAIAGAIYEFMPEHPGRDAAYRYVVLDDEDRVIATAIAPVMLGVEGATPQAVRGLDVAMAGLPLEVRAQLRQLFGILRFPPTRMVVCGIWQPWHHARPAQIARFLSAWRDSPVTQLRAGYDALHQLIMSAWYGNTDAWAAVGYSGPPKIT